VTPPATVVILYKNLREGQRYLPVDHQDVGRDLAALVERGMDLRLLAWAVWTPRDAPDRPPLYALAIPLDHADRRVAQGNHSWSPSATWSPRGDVFIPEVSACACGQVRRKRVPESGSAYFQYLVPGANPTKTSSWSRSRAACPADHYAIDLADTQAHTVPTRR
jgi:hypothetical protein